MLMSNKHNYLPEAWFCIAAKLVCCFHGRDVYFRSVDPSALNIENDLSQIYHIVFKAWQAWFGLTVNNRSRKDKP